MNSSRDPTDVASSHLTPSRLEALSSLVDGELDPRTAHELVTALCDDAELRRQWTAYHAVGDALRSSEVAATHSSAFCLRVWEAIEQEPTILAPRNLRRRSPLRRFLAPGLAVAASVAVIGFVAVPLMRTDAPATQPQVAQMAPATPVAAPQVAASGTSGAAAPTVASTSDADARRTVAAVQRARSLDAYLVAHRELMSGAALPRATPYLRDAGEQPEGR